MSVNSSQGWNESQNTSQGSSTGSSTGQNESQSQSTSFIPEQEPQLNFLTQFGNTAGQLGAQQYDWAQNQFENNSDLTEQNVNNYLQQGDMAGQAAQRDYANYNDIFNPAAGSLTDDWQSYTSPERVSDEMGRSEAGVAQNFEHQRGNLERSLQSYGINPSDPRYAGAMARMRTEQGAAEAGAGTQARLNTEATGRQLRQAALNEAHLLPGQQATEQNVSMQGSTGAQNAALANTSTGALTLGTTQNYLNAGIADVKFSPLGTASSSVGQGQNNSSNNSSNSSQGTAKGQNSSAGSSAGTGGGGSTQPASSTRPATNAPGMPATQPSQNPAGQPTGPMTAPNQPSTQGGGNPNAQIIGGLDQGGNSQGSTGTGGQNYNQPSQAEFAGTNYNQPSQAEFAGQNYNQPSQAEFAGQNYNQPSQQEWTTGSNDYAEGGDVGEEDQGGGFVPQSMSPSGGEQTDDIPAVIPQTGGKAQLNADEFVIPKDVVEWMGHKFFQDMIMKARKARQTNPGPAHPSMSGGHAAGGEGDPTAPQTQPTAQAQGIPMDGGNRFPQAQQAMTQAMNTLAPSGATPDSAQAAPPQQGIPDPTKGMGGSGPQTQPTGPGNAQADAPATAPQGGIPTMRAYQAGNRNQSFQPRANYFAPKAPIQRMPNPTFNPVTRTPGGSNTQAPPPLQLKPMQNNTGPQTQPTAQGIPMPAGGVGPTQAGGPASQGGGPGTYMGRTYEQLNAEAAAQAALTPNAGQRPNINSPAGWTQNSVMRRG